MVVLYGWDESAWVRKDGEGVSGVDPGVIVVGVFWVFWGSWSS